MGMERRIRFGDSTTAVSISDDDFLSTVVQCPKGGPMTIESKFESVYDIPLGDIAVDVVDVASGEVTPVTLDAQGLGTFLGEAGKSYRVHVQGEGVRQANRESVFFLRWPDHRSDGLVAR